jgi:hypothetical protein
MPQNSEATKTKAKEWLLNWLLPGDKVYCILRHKSTSGMRREISLVIFNGPDHLRLYLDHHTCDLLNYRMGKNEGVIVNGCGMDMGGHLVSSLSRALFDDERALKYEWL